MSDQERQGPGEPTKPLAPSNCFPIDSLEVFAKNESENCCLEAVCRNQWTTPTLRRLSLLNTLLFLGLALSHAKIDAHASSANGVNSKSVPIHSHPDLQTTSGDDPEHSQSVVLNSERDNRVGVDVNASPDDLQPEFSTFLDVIDHDDVFDDEEERNEEPAGKSQSTHETQADVIIVATVDGTLAAIEGSTGKLLWKKDGKGSKIHNIAGSSHDDGLKIPLEQSSDDRTSKLLHPLTATTTTASSTADSSVMAAIPSINGQVFLTTLDPHSDPRATPQSITRTDSASLKELVARAPYVDPSGRFYVGSRHTTAAAIDSGTGEILYVASANGIDEGGRMMNNMDPEWEGRSVVWLGRVDYSVSVYNAKSSTNEVQFSASEIMGVNDMVAGDTSPAKSQHNPVGPGTTKERAPDLLVQAEDELFQGSVLFADPPFSALVATPSGNLACRNQNTGRVEWVADEAFETPIVYAIHSSTGHSLDVDIIPDVTMPSNSKEYLTREIERQIALTLGAGDDDVPADENAPENCKSIRGSDTTQASIVGTLINGQLYSMPLGGRLQAALPSHSNSGTVKAKPQHVTLDLAAVQRHHSAASSSSLSSVPEKHVLANKMPQDEQLSTIRACGPSSPVFPGCLFRAVSKQVVGPLKLKRKESSAVGETRDELAESELAEIETFHFEQLDEEVPPFHSHYQQFHQDQPRQRNYRKVFKILGSWLPPTIALLFVVSFEMGRRKRQKDGLDVLQQVADGNVEANELLRSVDQKGEVSSSSGHQQMIQMTDEVLGFGGHGTVVFRGTLEGRKVAVKRMLKTYLASADREISLLIESDGHPNVVRYFLKEVKGDFVYLALELCDMSLHALIGTLVAAAQKDSEGDNSATPPTVSDATRRLLLQITTGVKHLHSLRIVHNDLKPANILLAVSKEAKSADKGASTAESIYKTFEKEHYVAKISDMGLGKMLAGQSSFGASASFRGQSSTAHSNGNIGIGPGTVGWMAPEAMRMKSSTTIASDASNAGDASPVDKVFSTTTRASRSVDVFSLGCIFYSTLVPGFHPFGEWYEREANIMHNRPCIEPLKAVSMEAYDLVSAMIQHNPRSRPTAQQICEHPFFWSLQRRLSFVCDLSDRLETDAGAAGSTCPPGSSAFSVHPLAIERNAAEIVGLTWDKALCKGLTEQRYRTYDPSSVRDLLRLLRNKKNHFQDLEASVRRKIGSDTDGLMQYFASCFPKLLMHCYKICCEILLPDDPLVEKYLLSTASYPASFTIVANESYRKVPPVLVEEPQFASEEESSQGKTGPLLVPSAEANATRSKPQAPNELLGGTEFFVEALASHLPKSSHSDDATEDFNECLTETLLLPQKHDLAELALETLNATIEKPMLPGKDENLQDDVVLWEGSTAAKTLNCRGWIRSDEEWSSRSGGATRKRNSTLVRCSEDPKFRTRLCNHWDVSMGTACPMKRKNKCVFAHGPVELRVKEGKKGRWGKLVDKNGNNSNPKHSGGEDSYGAARSIESTRKEEGKWNTKKSPDGTKKQDSNNKKKGRAPPKG